MVDWTFLSPTYLTAVVEWAATAVTVLALAWRRHDEYGAPSK